MKSLTLIHFLTGGLVVSMVIIAFLSGILISNSGEQTSSQETEVKSFANESFPTNTPYPTKTPTSNNVLNAQQPRSTNVPSAIPIKKLVQVNIEMTSKTYYCYEDKANELVNLDHKSQQSLQGYDICMVSVNSNYNSCAEKCIPLPQGEFMPCTEACLAQQNKEQQECIDKMPNYGNELLQKISQYCP